MSECKNNCGRIALESDKVVCCDCGHNFGYLVDVVDHAVLRCDAVKENEELKARVDELEADGERLWRFMEEDEEDYNHSGKPIRQLYQEWKATKESE